MTRILLVAGALFALVSGVATAAEAPLYGDELSANPAFARTFESIYNKRHSKADAIQMIGCQLVHDPNLNVNSLDRDACDIVAGSGKKAQCMEVLVWPRLVRNTDMGIDEGQPYPCAVIRRNIRSVAFKG